MDIHKPKPWHGLREFLKEYAIIVVGVLTALAGEQAVERLEWTHKVHAAEDAMRTELLVDDGPEVYQRAAIHDCLRSQLGAIRSAVETGAPRAELVRLIDGYQLDFLSYDTLAHEDATHAGVADHMSQAAALVWTKAYGMLPYMERANGEEANAVGQLRALRHSGGPLSEAEQAHVLDAVEALGVHEYSMWRAAAWVLPAIRKLGPLDDARMKLFLGRARDRYGAACVKDLPADWAG
jgi:hypothetical protein